MKIIQNSVIGCFFITCWSLLCSIWKGSVLRKIFVQFGLALSRNITGSWFCQLVWREGILPKRLSSSITYHVLILIVNLPITFVQRIYKI